MTAPRRIERHQRRGHERGRVPPRATAASTSGTVTPPRDAPTEGRNRRITADAQALASPISVIAAATSLALTRGRNSRPRQQRHHPGRVADIG